MIFRRGYQKGPIPRQCCSYSSVPMQMFVPSSQIRREETLMTCEVAVMNRLGVALAADSALTVGDGDKIYHHAKKLFALKPIIPVGIMIYGSAELMGVPWEIVIELYAQALGDKRF